MDEKPFSIVYSPGRDICYVLSCCISSRSRVHALIDGLKKWNLLTKKLMETRHFYFFKVDCEFQWRYRDHLFAWFWYQRWL